MAKKSLKVWEIAALAALSIGLCAGAWAGGKQQAISNKLVRLHVIAASDEAEEQAIKLVIRDAVLGYLAPRLEKAGTKAEAEALIRENIPGIAQAASQAAQGRSIKVTLSREAYPAREYEGFTLPGGKYDSLRVIIGEGKGKNWWCVAFPPLCLTAAGAQQLEQAMGGEDFSIVSEAEGYELRLKILELWGELMNRLSKSQALQPG